MRAARGEIKRGVQEHLPVQETRREREECKNLGRKEGEEGKRREKERGRGRKSSGGNV
jgi:hypothetical protein